jgi:hypothetical protein
MLFHGPDAINSLHGSDSEDTAKKELQFFFPMEQTVAAIKPDAEGTKGKKCKHNVLKCWILSYSFTSIFFLTFQKY